MSIFVDNKPIEMFDKTYLDCEFATLLSLAEESLETAEGKQHKYRQSVALLTAQGQQVTHAFCSDSVEELVEQNCALLSKLKSEGQTQIKKVVFMWADGSVDIPSFRFRKEMCALDPENYQTEILLTALHGYVIKKAADLF